MKDWIDKLHGFLHLNDRDILNDAGKISHELAVTKAETEYDNFNAERIKLKDAQDGDFEKFIKSSSSKKRRGKSNR